MVWAIETTNDFDTWFDALAVSQQAKVLVSVSILREIGPRLGRPHVDTVNGSRYLNMKELRVQASGAPLRIFFAFDPRRVALLLVGGNKTGRGRFYDLMIRRADTLYAEHLEALEDD
ncbi:MAG TPA: type II toxin-antitoxin system RelE/ParE family toxin [Candidatus Elarobacter sp.]|nr:type II toxin-antitoxin system RelE/ParE family toxin [Candidatus Elarobacter sp.]